MKSMIWRKSEDSPIVDEDHWSREEKGKTISRCLVIKRLVPL